jgi:hypothetical protein
MVWTAQKLQLPWAKLQQLIATLLLSIAEFSVNLVKALEKTDESAQINDAVFVAIKATAT